MAGPPSPGPWGVKGGDDVSTTPRTRQRQRRTKDQTKPAPLAVLYFVCFSFVILPATPLATRNPNNRRLSFLSQELSQVVHEHRPVLRPARQLRWLGGVERHAPHRLRVPVFVYVCVWFISMSAGGGLVWFGCVHGVGGHKVVADPTHRSMVCTQSFMARSHSFTRRSAPLSVHAWGEKTIAFRGGHPINNPLTRPQPTQRTTRRSGGRRGRPPRPAPTTRARRRSRPGRSGPCRLIWWGGGGIGQTGAPAFDSTAFVNTIAHAHLVDIDALVV